MSVEDEVRKAKERMQADMREAERQKQAEERLQKAFSESGIQSGYPNLIMPPADLQPVIDEMRPSMKFKAPKIVRSMPDGKIYTRPTRKKGSSNSMERADQYSFDAVVFTNGSGKGSTTQYLHVFQNGAIAFSSNYTNNLTWEKLKSDGLDAAKVREKIIEAMAQQSIDTDKARQSGGGGCYIATAVYGSYDCPEVWVLRRFRDYFLEKTIPGRVFVKVYYAISPILVSCLGNRKWFVSFWRKKLDALVLKLKQRGYSDEAYTDKE